MAATTTTPNKKFLNLSAEIHEDFIAKPEDFEEAAIDDDSESVGDLRPNSPSTNSKRDRSFSSNSATDLAPPLFTEAFRPRAGSSSNQQ